MPKEKILVTGSSGFIGMHLCISLLKDGYQVLGIDNMNDYYNVDLKNSRLEKLNKYINFNFEQYDITNLEKLTSSFKNFSPDKVVNLAAQAGVRYSINNPHSYIESNIVGFMNILECVRHFKIEGLIYASSSSVYGANTKLPFSVEDSTENQVSIYGVTKRTNELMANSYSHLYNINTTGLRFFTVYGPWGRPDMAMFIFADNIINNKEITVYNKGLMNRDFTYIDDIVGGIFSAIKKNYPCEIFNLGSSRSEKIMNMIKYIERAIGKKANITFEDIQLGDIKETLADIKYSEQKLGYKPTISLNKGIPKFMNWYKEHKNMKK